MSGGPGLARFDVRQTFDYIWINGTWYFFEENQGPAVDAPSVIPLATHGGTHFTQRPFRGTVKPKDYNAKKWSLKITANGETEWSALKATKATCAPFYFGKGLRVTDTFAATSGTTYRLTRPLASGIVTGANESEFPTLVNGGANGGDATVTGQNAVANITGTIRVEYTPAHVVVITAWSELVNTHNLGIVEATLEETLVP